MEIFRWSLMLDHWNQVRVGKMWIWCCNILFSHWQPQQVPDQFKVNLRLPRNLAKWRQLWFMTHKQVDWRKVEFTAWPLWFFVCGGLRTVKSVQMGLSLCLASLSAEQNSRNQNSLVLIKCPPSLSWWARLVYLHTNTSHKHVEKCSSLGLWWSFISLLEFDSDGLNLKTQN